MLVGESSIDQRTDNTEVAIDYVYLEPTAYAHAPVLKAIWEADAIVLGPGDIYTSVVPNLLVEDVADAIRESPCHQNLRLQHHDQTGASPTDSVPRTLLGWCRSTSRPINPWIMW